MTPISFVDRVPLGDAGGARPDILVRGLAPDSDAGSASPAVWDRR